MPALAKLPAAFKPGLEILFSKVKPVPSEWFTSESGKPIVSTAIKDCTSYAELLDYWRDTRTEPGGKPGAVYLTDSIDVALSFVAAIVGSTKLQGSQIWGRVLGPPGTVKTTICEAFSANREYTFAMSMQTGFHSGYGSNGEDNSLIPRIKDRTVIINEGDMLLNAPDRDRILAELRDIYSGVTRATYRNGKEYEHLGLRSTFILAGTAKLRQLNRGSLGDRFLDCVIYEKLVKSGPDKGEQELLQRVAIMALARCGAESNGELATQDDPYKVEAIQRTAGFVKHIRQTLPQRAGPIIAKIMEAAARGEKLPAFVSHCISLAQLTAYMRARPDKEAEGDENEVELPSRLTEQYIRLVVCLSIVMDREIDSEVMRRVAIIARDTCRGRPLAVITVLAENALDNSGIQRRTGYKEDTVRQLTRLLSSLGVIRSDTTIAANGALGTRRHVFRLSPQVSGLYSRMKFLIGEPR